MAWRERKQKFQQQLAGFLDLPKDIMMDLPKIVLVGNVQVFIENHRGIVEYSPELIRVSTTGGELEITGAELVLRAILPEEVIVEGKIQGVRFGG
ncbi:MAG: sporulation protein YqfC [Thermincolia bacterium]